MFGFPHLVIIRMTDHSTGGLMTTGAKTLKQELQVSQIRFSTFKKFKSGKIFGGIQLCYNSESPPPTRRLWKEFTISGFEIIDGVYERQPITRNGNVYYKRTEPSVMYVYRNPTEYGKDNWHFYHELGSGVSFGLKVLSSWKFRLVRRGHPQLMLHHMTDPFIGGQMMTGERTLQQRWKVSRIIFF